MSVRYNRSAPASPSQILFAAPDSFSNTPNASRENSPIPEEDDVDFQPPPKKYPTGRSNYIKSAPSSPTRGSPVAFRTVSSAVTKKESKHSRKSEIEEIDSDQVDDSEKLQRDHKIIRPTPVKVNQDHSDNSKDSALVSILRLQKNDGATSSKRQATSDGPAEKRTRFSTDGNVVEYDD